MSGNLDKILADLKKRTASDINKAEHDSHEKQEALLKQRHFLQG